MAAKNHPNNPPDRQHERSEFRYAPQSKTYGSLRTQAEPSTAQETYGRLTSFITAWGEVPVISAIRFHDTPRDLSRLASSACRALARSSRRMFKPTSPVEKRSCANAPEIWESSELPLRLEPVDEGTDTGTEIRTGSSTTAGRRAAAASRVSLIRS